MTTSPIAVPAAAATLLPALTTPEITQWPSSGRCAFEAGNGLRVVVEADGSGNDPERANEIRALAARLAGDAVTIAALDAAHAAEVSELRRQTIEADGARHNASLAAVVALAKIPPKKPARLFERGIVRFTEQGSKHGVLWLLDHKTLTKGWGAFGILLAGWDDLFRHYAVRVTDHGVDEWGCWWQVENNPEERTCTQCGGVARFGEMHEH